MGVAWIILSYIMEHHHVGKQSTLMKCDFPETTHPIEGVPQESSFYKVLLGEKLKSKIKTMRGKYLIRKYLVRPGID